MFPEWTQSQLSMPFSFHNITVCLMMLFTGPALLKLSNRLVLGIGGCAVLVGFGLFPFLPKDNPPAALIMAIIGFSVIAALSVGIGVIASFDTFLPWFPDHPGAVSGVLTFWCGVAPIALGALCGVFLKHFNVLWSIALLGVVISVFVFASLKWCKRPGPEVHLPPPPQKVEDELSEDYSPTRMLKTGTFWCVFVFNVTLRCAGLVISDLGGSIAIAIGIGALMGLLFAPANGLACIVGGFLMDRFTVEKVMLLMAAAVTAGGAALYFGNSADSTPMIILGIALVGFGYGGVTVTGVSGTRILFGMKHYAQNLGLVSVSIGPAAIAVIFAGKLNTGDAGGFGTIFLLILGFGAVAVVCCLLMHITERSRKANLEAKAAAGQSAE
jgi:MFS family permease